MSVARHYRQTKHLKTFIKKVSRRTELIPFDRFWKLAQEHVTFFTTMLAGAVNCVQGRGIITLSNQSSDSFTYPSESFYSA